MYQLTNEQQQQIQTNARDFMLSQIFKQLQTAKSQIWAAYEKDPQSFLCSDRVSVFDAIEELAYLTKFDIYLKTEAHAINISQKLEQLIQLNIEDALLTYRTAIDNNEQPQKGLNDLFFNLRELSDWVDDIMYNVDNGFWGFGVVIGLFDEELKMYENYAPKLEKYLERYPIGKTGNALKDFQEALDHYWGEINYMLSKRVERQFENVDIEVGFAR